MGGMVVAASVTDVVIAAPLAFTVGLVLGVFAGNRWVIVTPRHRDACDREEGGPG